jgi:ABC-type multidrug transport system permease subunit
MPTSSVRLWLLTLLALGVSAAATWGLGLFWTAIGGGDLPLHGWIAMGLGITGTVGLTWGLMTLAFKSNREGWDERVDNTLDPGRDERDRS